MMRIVNILSALLITVVPVKASEYAVAAGDYEPVLVRQNDAVVSGIALDLTEYLFPDPATRPSLIGLPVRRLALSSQMGEYAWLYFPCHIDLPLYRKHRSLFSVASGVVVKANGPIQNIAELSSHTVGVWAASAISIPGVDDNPAVQKRAFNTQEAALKMLQLGRIEAVTMSEFTLNYLSKTHDDIKRDDFRFIQSFVIAMCLHRHNDVPNELIAPMEKRIQQGIDNNVFQKILDKYR